MRWILAALVLAAPLPAQAITASAEGLTASSSATVTEAPVVAMAPLVTPRDASPHFDHIRPVFSDMCYCWDGSKGAAAKDWAARHYDEALSGKPEDWQARNPTMDRHRYTLLVSVLDEANGDPPSITGKFLNDMRAWYAEHPEYRMEDAFVHAKGDTIPADSAHRVHPFLWSTNRFVGNPADPGWRAYTLDRYRRMAADPTRTGLFIDEMDNFNIGHMLSPAREFTSVSQWQDALVSLVAEVRAAIAPMKLQINPAGYGNKPLEVRLAIAAGGVHLETMNHVTQEIPYVWTLVDSLLRRGVYVDLVNLEAWSDFEGGKGKLSKESYYPAGNYARPVYRAKLAQLASYYMVVPEDAQRLGLMDNGIRYPLTPDSVWLPAYTFDVGHPKAPRSVWLDTRDPVKQRARVYRRDFDNATVLIRPVVYWADTLLTDTTAVPVPLPEGAWSMVTARGGMVPVDSLALRNSEAVILVRRQ